MTSEYAAADELQMWAEWRLYLLKTKDRSLSYYAFKKQYERK